MAYGVWQMDMLLLRHSGFYITLAVDIVLYYITHVKRNYEVTDANVVILQSR